MEMTEETNLCNQSHIVWDCINQIKLIKMWSVEGLHSATAGKMVI